MVTRCGYIKDSVPWVTSEYRSRARKGVSCARLGKFYLVVLFFLLFSLKQFLLLSLQDGMNERGKRYASDKCYRTYDVVLNFHTKKHRKFRGFKGFMIAIEAIATGASGCTSVGCMQNPAFVIRVRIQEPIGAPSDVIIHVLSIRAVILGH